MAASISGPLLPTPTANLGSNGGPQDPRKRKAGGHSVSLEDAVHLLPTPDATHGRKSTRTSLLLPGAVLLPTPQATDGTNGGPNQRGSKGDLMLPSAVHPHGPTTSPDTGPRSSARNSPSDDLFHRHENRDETGNDSPRDLGSG